MFIKRAAILLLAIFVSPFSKGETVDTQKPMIKAEKWNEVRILDQKGAEVMTFGGFQVKGVPNGQTRAGEIKKMGDSTVVVYDTGTEETPSPVKVVGRFTPRPWCVDVEFSVTGAPADASLGGSMFLRRFAQKVTQGELLKPGLWTRHSNGGIPYEVSEGQVIPYDAEGRKVVFVFGRGNQVNPEWKDVSSQHAGLKKNEDGSSATKFTIVLPKTGWSVDALAAKANDRPVALTLSTEKVYNWWSDNSLPLEVTAAVTNVTPRPREVELTYWGKDYSGAVVGEGKRDLTISAGAVPEEKLAFNFPASRGMVFVEVTVKDKQTGSEVFARTNLTVLPPHEFKATSTNSLFGLSAYWPIPSEEEAQRLMERMGVRWLRHGNSHDYKNITAIHHSNPKWSGDKVLTGAEREAWIRKELQQCLDHGNPWWEFGNELNMSTAGIAMEGEGIGKALLAEPYVEWLKEVHRIRKEMGAEDKVKIMSFGVAGMDLKFVDKLRELGGWDLIEGFALHPGRGNVAPDYPVSDPFAPWKVGPKGGYWNYYGSVKTAALMLKEYGGDKPLWLTEIYAPTFPNSFWEDSLRHGTENLVLTYALAQAENVKSAMWYQLFDSVWHNRLGVSEKDREYHFGLVNRDQSLKPLVLAYATTAEALDEAKFNRWLKLPDPDLKGLLFDTPRGPVSILWSRKDGYTLTKKVPNFPSPEPWVDTWKTKTELSAPVAGEALTAIDPIGRKSEIPAVDGKATLTLTGAPVIVYGVDAARLETPKE